MAEYLLTLCVKPWVQSLMPPPQQQQNPKPQTAKPNWPMTLQLSSHPKPDSKLGVIICIYNLCTTETEARQYGLEGSFLIKAWLAHITKATKYLGGNTLPPQEFHEVGIVRYLI